MSGIPVYTQSPINAAKASGQTPQTEAPQPSASFGQSPAPATTTATSTTTYPPARPGAAAMPAPTTPASQRYAPVHPTPTTKTDIDVPPAPQPGAVPSPSNRSTIPPPPKDGESYHPPTAGATPTVSNPTQFYPSQMSIPPPTSAYRAQPPASSTSTTTTPSVSYPVSVSTGEYGAPGLGLEHPPGYHQDQYASELTSDQRRAQEAHNASRPQNSGESVGGLDTDGVWNTAKKWAVQAGEKLSEAEAEVWRKINKK